MDSVIPQRSALLAVVLSGALVFILVKTYLLWTDGPRDLPQPPKVSSSAPSSQANAPATQPRLAAPDLLISKNLFDPERGAGQTKEAEANSRAMQRLKSLVLLGTAILGDSRYAILQDGGAPAAGRPPQGQTAGTMRFKMGDTFEGFSLSQIQDKNVVFTNGASRVELALDYFRKVEPSAPRPQAAAAASPGAAPSPADPRVIPQLPRRERLPAPPSSALSGVRNPLTTDCQAYKTTLILRISAPSLLQSHTPLSINCNFNCGIRIHSNPEIQD